MQQKHYTELSGQMETIRTMRHDIRHHFTQLSLLLKEGRFEDAGNYLNQVSEDSLKTTPLTFCENYAADVLLRYYYARAEEEQIPVTIRAVTPSLTGISYGDLSVVLGNILENALEANLRLPKARLFLTLDITRHSDNLFLESSNVFDGELTAKDRHYDSRKEKGRVGIGFSSVRSIAEKYDGEVWADTGKSAGGSVFTIHVLLIDRKL